MIACLDQQMPCQKRVELRDQFHNSQTVSIMYRTKQVEGDTMDAEGQKEEDQDLGGGGPGYTLSMQCPTFINVYCHVNIEKNVVAAGTH